jgi:hypothetical protein
MRMSWKVVRTVEMEREAGADEDTNSDDITSEGEAENEKFLAGAINADESSYDGDWEVFKSLLDSEQSATPDERLEDEINLIHGDLVTMEKITIEKSAKNHRTWTFPPEDGCDQCVLEEPYSLQKVEMIRKDIMNDEVSWLRV